MDENRTLSDIREQIKRARDAKDESERRDALANVVQSFEELDESLKNGGPLPVDWEWGEDR